MDVRKSFSFVFEDREWVTKVLVGVLMSLFAWLIIPAFMLTGYMVEIIRRVMDGVESDQELPPWDDWGKLLKDGFFVSVATLIYTLPFLILMAIGFGSTIGFGGLSDANESLASAGLMATWGVVGCLSLLFGIALLFVTPAITIQYAIKDDFGACFRFGEVFDIIRNHVADILITFVVIMAAGFGLSLVTGVLSFIPCLGWIAALIMSLVFGPYIMMVTGHLYGQIGAKVLGNKAGGTLAG